MSFSSEYNKLRRKRLQEQANQNAASADDFSADNFSKEYNALRKKRLSSNASALTSESKDRLRTLLNESGVVSSDRTKKDSSSKESTWFESGTFKDGYQFGDVIKGILATGYDATENMYAGIIGMGEGIVDAVAGYYGAVGGLLGADEFQGNVEEFIKKDLYDEKEVSKKLLSGTVLGHFTDPDEESFLGDKSDSIAQSGGQLMATSALNAMGLPWWLTTGVTTFGGEMESALNQDATYGEAVGSSLISAGAEILTEKLSGGIKFGGKTLDDVLLQPLVNKISNKVGRTLVNLGLDAAGEGLEEVITSVFSRLGSALYKEESIGELLTSEEAMDEYLTSFISGGVLGGGMGGINAVNSIKTGRDYKTGLTENEQSVLDKVIESRLSEAQSDGKKLSGKEKTKIYNQVLNDLQKGYISTDVIESALGGETYKAYQDSLSAENTLKQQIEELENLAKEKITVKQSEQLADAREKLKNLDNAAAKTRLSEEVQKALTRDTKFGKQTDDYLLESYNERGRRSQTFQADLSKYDTKQQSVIKNAIDSGILNNTNRTHEFVDMIAKISADKGVSFDFTNNARLKESGFALEGVTVNGYVQNGNVTVNINSQKALNAVVGHEVTHILEGTELYNQLQNAIFEYAKSKGDYGKKLENIQKLYETIEGADINAELTADLVGEYLFTDRSFINNLSANHRNIFQKIYDEIKYLCKVATSGSKEARELEKVKKIFDQAYKETTQQKNTAYSGVRYSLGETTDGRFVAIVDDDILRNFDTDSWDKSKKEAAQKAAADALKQFKDGIVVNDISYTVNQDSRNEYTRGNSTEKLFKRFPDIFSDKLRAADVTDDVIFATTDWSRDGKLKHSRKDNFVDFARGNTLIASGNAKYSAEVVIGIKSSGETVFYDVTKISPTEFDIKKTESPSSTYAQNVRSAIQGDPDSNSISENTEKSTSETKKSLSSDEDTDNFPFGSHLTYGRDIELLTDDPPTRDDIPSAKETTSDPLEGVPIRDDIPPKTGDSTVTDDLPIRDDISPTEETTTDPLDGIPIREDLDQAHEDFVKSVLETTETNSNAPILTTEQELTAKIRNFENELHNNVLMREWSSAEFDYKISELQAKYEGKKNKESPSAQILLQRIDKLKTEKANLDARYEKRINQTQKKIDKLNKRLTHNHNQADRLKRFKSRSEKLLEIEKAELSKEFDQKREELSKAIGDKDAFIQSEATALYDELRRLRKGVRASEQLGYLLDHYEWGNLKSALVNIKTRPSEIVNLNSETELGVRKYLDDIRESKVEDLNNLEDEHRQRIRELEENAEKELETFKVANQRMTKWQEYSDQMEELAGDTSTWVDKKLGISYRVNTLRRNLRDIVRDSDGKRDIAKADAIYDELQGKYNHNEAELNREATRIKQKYADMKITAAENVYIQMLGELRHNPDTKLTTDKVREFYEKHRDKIDENKVNKAIELARETYDSLLIRVNEVLKEQGMRTIPYRQGYFPHFTEEKQGVLAKLLNWKTRNDDIPTDIAGLTETFNPKRSWQSFDKQRKGDGTDYNFLKGLDTYVQGALDWIYHIEDIQKRRAFESHIRYVHSDQGVQDKIDAIQKNATYDADEMQEQIDLVYKKAGNPLNNFVTDFRSATNTLVNKKSSMDRGMEELTNRKFYSVMTNLSNRVTANMVGGSVSSALTNFIPITQSWGEVSPISSLVAMKQTIASKFKDDGVVDKSDFLTNRLKKSENLYKTTWDKISDKAGIMMDIVDGFTSQTVWRSKYRENINKGMSETEAIKNADQFAENVLAGRSRGNAPTIFDSKNPLIKTLTVFQLEVNNQYGYMFKDMPQSLQTRSVANLVKGYATMFIGAWVYNGLYSAITGRDAAFDPIGIITELLQDMGLIGDDEEEETSDIVMNFTDNVLQEVPFVGSLLGGGRIPISSALPYGEGVYEAFSGTLEDLEDGDWEGLTKEWMNPVAYLLPPVGGGQIKKTLQGYFMFDDDLPISGSYTDSGNLRFPVEDTALNRTQAYLFGQWASGNARDYFDNERTPLEDDQIQEFLDSGLTIQEYWDYREGLAALNEPNDPASLAEKADYIANLDLPIDTKNLFINNIADRKEEIDLTDYEIYQGFEEFDFATQNPEKYEFLKENNVSFAEYQSMDEDSKSAYNWAFKNPEKFTLAKAIADDVVVYRQYTSDINDIEADKDENGNSISGSRKKKIIQYINGLDADYGEKIILFKSIYSNDDTYNREIVRYLNDRDDISYKETETILKELGFTVLSDGTVEW